MNLINAIRNKYRFPSVVGLLTLEDVFDLPLKSTRANRADLDGVAKEINRQLREEQEDSFVETRANPRKTLLTEQLDIVKEVIAIKQAENAAEVEKAKRAQTKDKLLEILGRKQDQELESKTPEELRAMLDSIG